jgi:hypothetical protein
VSKLCQVSLGTVVLRPILVIVAMNEEIAFLLNAAEELRALALTAPEVASELRRTADELEARAAELSRHGRGRYSRGRDSLS